MLNDNDTTTQQNTIFIGIARSSGQAMAFAVIDKNSNLIKLAAAKPDKILEHIGTYESAFIALGIPSQPNQGLMANPVIRQQFSPELKRGRYVNMRLVDYELHRQNIKSPRVPKTVESCPVWMKLGFLLHQNLAKMEYKTFPFTGAPCQKMEAFPEASFSALLGQKPLDAKTLEGRLQRQLLLYELGLPVSDSMEFFEEITRYRMLYGNLPFKLILTPAELDAVVLAYTAWLAKNKPHRLTFLGDQQEGQIVIPAQHTNI